MQATAREGEIETRQEGEMLQEKNEEDERRERERERSEDGEEHMGTPKWMK